jgi:hypothetical protein
VEGRSTGALWHIWKHHERKIAESRIGSISSGVEYYFGLQPPFLIDADVRTLTLVDDPIGLKAYDTVRNVPDGKIAILQYIFPKPGTIEPAIQLSFESGVTYYEE